MYLNDIWFSYNKISSCFTKDNFRKIENQSGIYAWYYPLRLTSRKKPSELIWEIYYLYDYDVNGEDIYFQGNIETNFKWVNALFDVRIKNNIDSKILEKIDKKFEKLLEGGYSIEDLQSALMKSTLFMKPLYIGKSSNLNTRIDQHIRGVSGFSNRFNNFIEKTNLRIVSDSSPLQILPIHSVRDLLVSTVYMNDIKISDLNHNNSEEVNENDLKNYILEETLKMVVQPTYSKL